MPRKPIDYSRTVIYKIFCLDNSIQDCYVGHTTQFKERKASHKSGCIYPTSKSYNRKVYCFIRDHGGWDAWNMVLVEAFPCENALEARKRERHWIVQLGATLNTLLPSRTHQEWYEENKTILYEKRKHKVEEDREHYLTLRKTYYDNNRDKILEQQKISYEKRKDKIADYKKVYYEENKDRYTEYKKNWYETNKQKILDKKRQRYEQNKEDINQRRRDLYQQKKLENQVV